MTATINGHLADEIARKSSLRVTEIDSLFPTEGDKFLLNETVDLVRSDMHDSQKAEKLAGSISRLAPILIRLLARI